MLATMFRTAVALVALTAVAGLGCSDKEKVFEAETPRGEVEVERDTDTGEVDVNVEKE